MKKRIFIFVIALAVLVPPAFMVYRRIQNAFVASEIRAELEEWRKTLVIVPDGENGALPILEGTDKFRGYLDYWGNTVEDFDPGCSSYIKKAREYIEGKAQAFEKINEGLGYERFQYTKPDIDFFTDDFPSFLGLKFAVESLVLKGRLLELDGKGDEALEEYLNGLRLSITMKDEMFVINRMIEVAMACMTLEVFYEKFSNASLSKEQLRKSLDELTGLYYEPPGDMFVFQYYMMIKGAKIFCEGTLYFKETPDFNGSIDFEELWTKQCALFNRWHADFRSDYDLLKKWHAHYRDIDFLKLYDIPDNKQRGSFEKTLREKHRWDYRHVPHWSSVAFASPAWNSLLEKDMYWRGAAIICAIKLYEAENGRLPDSLDAISGLMPAKMMIDPFSGKNFIYKTKGNAFQLYSVGENGTDDNCTAPQELHHRHHLQCGPDLIYHKGF